MFKENFFPEIPAQSEERNESESEDGRFAFYTDKKKTQHNVLSSEKETADYKKELFDYKEMLTKDELKECGIEDDPNFVEKAERIKEEITDFAKQLGFDVANYLPKNENIYELDTELFELITTNSNYWGEHTANEVFVKKNLNEIDKLSTLRHEMIHSISKMKFILRKCDSDNHKIKNISTGYGISSSKENNYDNEFLLNFSEGLTELTNLQIAIQYEGECSVEVAYIYNVILISELVKDIANHERITSKDILSSFQTGMLDGDSRYLKVISDLYDNESGNFNALRTLSRMGTKKEEVLAVAQAFGLTEAIEKINNYSDKERIEIDIANFSIPLND